MLEQTTHVKEQSRYKKQDLKQNKGSENLKKGLTSEYFVVENYSFVWIYWGKIGSAQIYLLPICSKKKIQFAKTAGNGILAIVW